MLFASVSSRTLSRKLGDSAVSLPPLVLGDTWDERIRLTKDVNGTEVEIEREIVSLKAALGYKDARPLRGSFTLQIGPDPQVANNTTGDISYDFAAEGAADAFQASLNATGIIDVDETYGAATNAVYQDGSIIWEMDGETDEIEFTVADNLLTPVSGIRITSYLIGSVRKYEIRLIQLPFAQFTGGELAVPAPPKVVRVQTGAEEAGGYQLPEIQELIFNPEFRGSINLQRGSKKTDAFLQSISPAALKELMDDALTTAGEGEIFTVEVARNNVAKIIFGGSMTGAPQDLLTVNVVSAPAGDIDVALQLNKREAFAALRGGELEDVPLEIEVVYVDPQDSERNHRVTWQTEVTFTGELNSADLSSLEPIDYAAPGLPKDYIPLDPSQVRTGVQYYSAAFPQAPDVGNTEFEITHALDTDFLSGILVRENQTPGRVLIHGTDYTVVIDESNRVTLEILTGGTPTLEQYVVTIAGSEPVDQHQAHTQAIATITGLEAIITDLTSRLEVVEAIPTSGFRRSDPDIDVTGQEWAIPDFGEIKPTFDPRTGSLAPETGQLLSTFDRSILPSRGGAPILLPAIHATSATALPTVEEDGRTYPAAAAAGYVGTLYQNQTGDDVIITGGSGRGPYTLPDDGYAACTGRYWYPLVQYGSSPGSSYYPVQMEHTLFEEEISAQNLIDGRTMEAQWEIELGTIRAETAYHYLYVIEVGTWPGVTTPGTPGSNFSGYVWDPDPVFSERILVNAVPRRYRLGYKVDLEDETLSAGALLHGRWSSADAPAAAEFAFRARLIRADAADSDPELTGWLWISGPTFEDSDSVVGKIRIY